jgi:hypothetical protein
MWHEWRDNAYNVLDNLKRKKLRNNKRSCEDRMLNVSHRNEVRNFDLDS